ncbi:DUF6020 family protein [Butyrivibrio sp.]|uniref:DUF6020 family protein n=1 Tax=Butyrivibrio sp. TaxID=28121 RepID=UPI0025BC7F17|nr:DUF6020 family protein [Butyrivibrio sp.]MBQ7430614.1 hypothetical protein [Butyrivibrio sp.]MBQ9302774.1 hypothetical protein [Butyrivibrio sp.]
MKKEKLMIVPFLYGAFLSLAITWGYQLEKYDHLELMSIRYLIIWLALSLAIGILVSLSYKLLDNKKAQKSLHTRQHWSYSDTIFFKRIWLILILCQIPVLLAVFPGFFCYDAQDEVNEVLTRTFTTHHPLLHVLLLGGAVAFGHKLTGSYNAGIALYIVFQMIVIDAILAGLLTYLRRKEVKKLVLILFTLFFGFFPTVVMYVLCSCKDGLFSAFLVLTIAFLFQLQDDLEAFTTSRRKKVFFVLSAALMMLFRHNGFYAYLVMIPFMLILYKKAFKKVVVMFIAPVILYLALSAAMSTVLQADSSENQEMLTVPIQQIARAYTYNRDDFTEDDIDALLQYLSEDALSLYTPRVSDLLKSQFDNEAYASDSAGFWKLWFKYFKKYPVTYLNAWFMTSYGMWYPGAVINVYQGNTMFTFTYTDSSYFAYEVELPGERHSFIPVIDAFYRKLSIERFQQNTPVVSLLFSPAFYFWLYMYVACYYARNRKLKACRPLMLMLLVWLTVLLGPTYLVRYAVYLWFGLPLLLMIDTRGKQAL